MINWTPGVTLDDVEKQVILKAISFFGGNKTVTARTLGIAVRTLDYKLERYKRGEDGRTTQEDETKNISSEAGIRVEPAHEAPKEHAVSVRKSKKV